MEEVLLTNKAIRTYLETHFLPEAWDNALKYTILLGIECLTRDATTMISMRKLEELLKQRNIVHQADEKVPYVSRIFKVNFRVPSEHEAASFRREHLRKETNQWYASTS